jgi:SPX domain protein involved in polyphosphate accumulation
MTNENSSIHSLRLEDKYIISSDLIPYFLKLFNAFMKPYRPEGAVKGSSVSNQSIYFDTKELECLKAHLNGDQKRKKIRIRSYFQDGDKLSAQFLEIKRKDGDKSIKTRIEIGQDHFNSLMHSSSIPIDEELIILNEDTMNKTDLILNIKDINHVLNSGNYKPVINIKYKRQAFQTGEDFRVTVDEFLIVKPSDYFNSSSLDKKDRKELEKIYSKFANGDDYIIEVKHKGSIPKWLTKAFEKHFIETESFSKYCYAIAKVVRNE